MEGCGGQSMSAEQAYSFNPLPAGLGWKGPPPEGDETMTTSFNPLPAGLGWKAVRCAGQQSAAQGFNPLPAGLGWKVAGDGNRMLM